MRRLVTLGSAGLLLLILLPSEGEAQARTVQPGAPGTASTILTPEDMVVPERLRHTEADVRFMQDMMHHHQQAVEMSRMAHGRTENPTILQLAERIERTQADEIALMTRWLTLRGEAVPELNGEQDHDMMGHHGHHAGDDDAAHCPHHDDHRDQHPDHPGDHGQMDHGDQDHDQMDPHHGMPGMLTPAQLQELAAAQDQEFDRRLLEFMIYHHEGAIQMVSELFASPGAVQDSDIFQFAAHVEADQEIEIIRMEEILRRGG